MEIIILYLISAVIIISLLIVYFDLNEKIQKEKNLVNEAIKKYDQRTKDMEAFITSQNVQFQQVISNAKLQIENFCKVNQTVKDEIESKRSEADQLIKDLMKDLETEGVNFVYEKEFIPSVNNTVGMPQALRNKIDQERKLYGNEKIIITFSYDSKEELYDALYDLKTKKIPNKREFRKKYRVFRNYNEMVSFAYENIHDKDAVKNSLSNSIKRELGSEIADALIDDNSELSTMDGTTIKRNRPITPAVPKKISYK